MNTWLKGNVNRSINRILNDLLMFGTKTVPVVKSTVWALADWVGWFGAEKSNANRTAPVAIDNAIRDISAMISIHTSNSKYNRWKRLLTEVLNGGGIWKAVVRGNNYMAYQDEYRNGTLAVEGRDRYAQSRRAYPGKLRIVQAVRSMKGKKQVHSAVAKKYKSVLDNGDAPMPIVGSGPLTSAGNYEITFLYFGSLVNAALRVMEQVRSQNTAAMQNKIEFLLGPIDLPTFSRAGSLETQTVSLADVPISLDLFLQFFVSITVFLKLTS